MVAEVRSVRVVLEADIASYMAKMKAAGRITKEAFGGGNGSQTPWISKAMLEVEQSTNKAGTAARKAGKDVNGLGESMGKTGRKTREFTLEQAVAAERASRLRNELRMQARAAVDVEQGLNHLRDGTKRAGRELDTFSGRMGVATDAALTLGPALIPIGAAGIGALTGLGAAAGAAAGGAGVMALAFIGVGKAVKALNDYQLEPTKAHLQALNEAMSNMGTSGARFVRFIDSLSSDLRTLQLIARNRMFPGITDGIQSLLTLMPEAKSLVAGLATEIGKLAREAGASLSGSAWAGFIRYVSTDAVPTLDALAHTVGNVALGLADLFVAFAPASRDFTTGMENASAAFAHWAANVSKTQGFQEFLGYVRSEGPQVVSLLEALGRMLLGVGKAAAPVGNAVLPLLTSLANILATIANSPVGPALYATAAAMIAVSRATALAQTAMTRFGTTSTAAAASADAAAVSAGRLSLAMKGVLALGAGAAVGGLVTDAFDKVGGDINKVGNSLAHGGQSKFRSPATIVTLGQFNPEHFGDRAPVKQADAQLGQMVMAGRATQAAQLLKKYADAANMSVAKASKQFPLYTAAVQAAQAATSGYNSTLKGTAEASQLTAAQIDGLVSAMQEQKTAALAAFDSETQYRQALKDAAAQAKTNNAGIKGNSDAALKNRQALSQLAAAWNNQSDAVKNNTGKFRQARRDFITTATAMGVPEAAARRLAARILQIPRSRVVQINASTGQAEGAIAHINDLLNSLNGKVAHTYIVTQQSFNSKRAGLPVGGAGADGMTVPGPRYPYGDKTLILAAPGEEVISNRHGQADHFRADRAAGRIPAYAGGGTVGRRPTADDVANMTVGQIRRLNLEFSNLVRVLNKATTLQQKQTETAQQAFDDVKQRREGYASTYTQALTRDIWGGNGSTSAFTGGYAANSILGATQQLNMQSQDAKDMQRLEKILRERGVHGGALDAILSGGIDRVRSAASATVAQDRAYELAYDNAQKFTATAANYGAALLTPQFDALKQAEEQQVAQLQAIEQTLKHAEQARRKQAATHTKAVTHAPKRARRG